MTLRNILMTSALLAVVGSAAATPEVSTPPLATYAPPVPPQDRHAYFGELHLHTTLSFDAWTFGTKVTPDQAYRFARGETVMVPAVQVSKEQGGAATGDSLLELAIMPVRVGPGNSTDTPISRWASSSRRVSDKPTTENLAAL